MLFRLLRTSTCWTFRPVNHCFGPSSLKAQGSRGVVGTSMGPGTFSGEVWHLHWRPPRSFGMHIYIYVYTWFSVDSLHLAKGLAKIRRLSSPGELHSFTKNSWGPLFPLAGLVFIYNGSTILIYGYAIYIYQVISYPIGSMVLVYMLTFGVYWW